jgi:4-hydroxybenzoate polyprenyltransferase
MLFAGLTRGALNIVGDVLDRRRDETTAPYLPIPAGLVSVPVALAGAAVVAAAALAAAWGASGADAGAFTKVILLMTAVTLLGMLYTPLKRFGFAGPIVLGVSQSAAPLAGWILAGGSGDVVVLVAVLAYAGISLIANNVLAALRDVDLDGAVGNNTVAVRAGVDTSLQVGFVLSVVVGAIALAVAVYNGQPLAAIVAAVTFARVVTAYRKAGTMFVGMTDRANRDGAIEVFRSSTFWFHLALLAAFSPAAAVAFWAFAKLLFPLQSGGYRRRIVGGGLQQQASVSMGLA